nr:MAG TPA: hypothetical protein [Caudoviricetes sp.]
MILYQNYRKIAQNLSNDIYIPLFLCYCKKVIIACRQYIGFFGGGQYAIVHQLYAIAQQKGMLICNRPTGYA